MKKVTIIGSSSGIGKELVEALAKEGYILGLAARRIELLEELKKELGGEIYIKRMDVSRPEEASELLASLSKICGKWTCSSYARDRSYKTRAWKYEGETIDVKGFTALADAGMKYFLQKGEGHSGFGKTYCNHRYQAGLTLRSSAETKTPR